MSLSSFKELQREYWMAGSQTKGGGGKWNETHEDRTSTTNSNNNNNAGDKILTPCQHAYIQETSIHFVPCVHRNRRLSRIFLKSLSPSNILNTELLPSQIRYKIPPSSSGFTLRSSPCWTSLDNLPRRVPWRASKSGAQTFSTASFERKGAPLPSSLWVWALSPSLNAVTPQRELISAASIQDLGLSVLKDPEIIKLLHLVQQLTPTRWEEHQ